VNCYDKAAWIQGLHACMQHVKYKSRTTKKIKKTKSISRFVSSLDGHSNNGPEIGNGRLDTQASSECVTRDAHRAVRLPTRSLVAVWSVRVESVKYVSCASSHVFVPFAFRLRLNSSRV
jgi:hypothetical protein